MLRLTLDNSEMLPLILDNSEMLPLTLDNSEMLRLTFDNLEPMVLLKWFKWYFIIKIVRQMYTIPGTQMWDGRREHTRSWGKNCGSPEL